MEIKAPVEYRNKVINCDVREGFRLLPDECVDVIVTSPPYWGLRDYGTAKWEGGDINCDHIKHSDIIKRATGHSTLQGSTSSQLESAIAQTKYRDICGKCGALRIDMQLGLEASPELYTTNMVDIFEQSKRVLKPDGTLWLNIGDSYFGGKGQSVSRDGKYHAERAAKGDSINKEYQQMGGKDLTRPQDMKHVGLKPKDLVGIPWRLAFALQGFAVVPFHSLGEWADILKLAREKNDWELVKMVEDTLRSMDLLQSFTKKGWYLRQDIIWSKKNCLPESVEDRCTKSHEYIFLLAKNKNYYFDYVAIKQEAKYDGRKDTVMKGSIKYANGYAPNTNPNTLHVKGHERWKRKHDGLNTGTDGKGFKGHSGYDILDNPYVANKRSVWNVGTLPYKDAHFATFNPDLIVDCIKAGSSEYGCCGKCGKPWKMQVRKELIPTAKASYNSTVDERDLNADSNDAGSNLMKDGHKPGWINATEIIGWEPTCVCNGKFEKQVDAEGKEVIVYIPSIPLKEHPIVPAVVLDPFMGSGTTAIVARKLGRDFTGFELNEKYCKLIKKRLYKEFGMFNT